MSHKQTWIIRSGPTASDIGDQRLPHTGRQGQQSLTSHLAWTQANSPGGQIQVVESQSGHFSDAQSKGHHAKGHGVIAPTTGPGPIEGFEKCTPLNLRHNGRQSCESPLPKVRHRLHEAGVHTSQVLQPAEEAAHGDSGNLSCSKPAVTAKLSDKVLHLLGSETSPLDAFRPKHE
jgi:hypothetical protein